LTLPPFGFIEESVAAGERVVMPAFRSVVAELLAMVASPLIRASIHDYVVDNQPLV
jgi:hypothetical protein